MSERSRASRRAEEQRHDLNQRLRATFIEGAEERSREQLSRGLTDEELRRIMRRYPGDLPER
ncbi:MAG: hypothetical protein Q7S35_05995 [Candidatus Limnocylindrales bacterium]|nr:hypothetical protein [Candidatus Limnocylindrales bacterium]